MKHTETDWLNSLYKINQEHRNQRKKYCNYLIMQNKYYSLLDRIYL